MKKRLAILLLVALFVGSELQAQDAAKPELRTWKDSTGQFSIEATFVRVTGDQVVLQRTDKKEISLPLAKLSVADQQYVKARLTPAPSGKNQQEAIAVLEKLGAKIKRNDNGDVSHIALYAIRPSERLKALPHLKALTNLQDLDLDITQITDAGLADLKGLTKLQSLSFKSLVVTDAGLVHLKGMTKLQSLSLGLCGQITDAGLVHFKGLTNLQRLGLHNTPVTDAGLAHFKGLTKLTFLNLHGNKITDAGLVHLTGLTELRELDLGRNRAITGAGLVHLKGMTNLKSLRLDYTQITDAGLMHLKGLTELRELDLGSGSQKTKFTDAGLVHLKGMTKLRELRLGLGTQVSAAGVADLQKALPNCKIAKY